uniref:Protein SMG7 isoform X1 n=1 Tax=Rhizophora mucronata TaxID=61149 RepID=A0A2P2IKH7_RHIMU
MQLPQSIFNIVLLRKTMILKNYSFIVLTHLLPGIGI